MERDGQHGIEIPSSLAEFGRRVESAAKRIGSLEKAADCAGISVSQLKRYISGKNQPTLVAMANLADGANVNLSWLATGRGVMARGEEAPDQLATTPKVVHEAASPEIDGDLCGKISEMLLGVYRECGVTVTFRQVVAEATRITLDVSGPDYTDADRPGAIRYAVAQLRRQLLVANTDAVSSKSSG